MKNQKSKIKNFYYIFFVFYFLLSTIYFPATYVFAQEATSSAEPTNSEISISPSPSPDPFTPTLTSSPTQPPSTPTEEISVSTPSANLTQPQQINPSQFSSPETLSAKIRKPRKIKSLSKKIFQAKDPLKIEVANNYKENLTVWVKDQNGKNLPIAVEQIHSEENSKIKVYPPQRFKPGKYTINISDSHGNFSEQNFTWGVLAINTNKSIYLPRETVNFAITVLDEAGSMVCNAIVGLDVVGPTGARTSFGTENKSIIINPDCSERDLHPNPDYETSLTLGEEVGIYQMTLTAETQNGKYTVTDSFDVRESVAFDVERIATTRIFPLNPYEVIMRITANQDFDGVVTETVPADFKINPAKTGGVRSYDNYDNVASDAASLQNAEVVRIPSSTLLSPFNGNFTQTQGFGEVPGNILLRLRYLMLGLERHDGVDFAMPEGSPIQSVDSGEIIKSGWGDYGITVAIQHDWGTSYYGHLSKTNFSDGQEVRAGDVIGLSGNTGLSTGPHLHFALKLNNSEGKVDPLAFINQDKNLLAKNDNVLGVNSSSYDVKKINWNLSLKQGETVTIGYVFKAPMISPQFYLLGPLAFKSEILNSKSETNSNFQNSNVQNLEATISATFDSSTSAQLLINNQNGLENSNLENSKIVSSFDISASNLRPTENAVFTEARQWQIAADADVTLDNSTGVVDARQKSEPHNVFISDQVGYAFFTDAGQLCAYVKTTDGGANWGSAVDVGDAAAGACIHNAIWFDRWTPGDNSGNYIHIAMIDNTDADLFYERLDTRNDAELGEVAIDTSSLDLGGVDDLAITKSRSGALYVGLTDNTTAGTSKVLTCNPVGQADDYCKTAANWSAVGSSPLDQDNDAIRLLPFYGQGANPDDDVMLIRNDLSLDDIEYNIWSGSSWSGWTDIDANAPDSATFPNALSATVRRYNNHIYIAYVANTAGAGTADVRTAFYDGTSFAVKTEVVSDQSSAYDTAIALDEESGTVYVSYIRGSTATTKDVYYKSSTDTMITWGNEVQLNASYTGGDNEHTLLNLVDNERIYFTYWNETNADLMGDRVVNLTPPTLDEVMRHGDWWSKVGTRKSFSW